MIGEVFKKDIRDQLFTFRFIFGLILCLIVFPIFTDFIGQDYVAKQQKYLDRVQEYKSKISGVMVYNNIIPAIYRPPSKLSFFAKGIEDQIPPSANVLFRWGVTLPFQSYGSTLLEKFPSFDLTFLVTYIISLLALFFGYNAISGEREAGTIRIALSSQCSRWQFLIGKITAGMVLLTVVISAGLLSSVLTLYLRHGISFGFRDWLLVILLFAVTALLAFTFFNVGILFSTLFRQSAASLVAGLLAWALLTICYPVTVGAMVNRFVSSPSYEALRANSREIETETNEKKRELQPEIDSQLPPLFPNENPKGGFTSMNPDPGPYGHFWIVHDRRTALKKQISHQLTVPLDLEAAERRIRAQDEYFRRMNDKKRYFSILSWPNPVAAFGEAATGISGTDDSAFFDFYEQAKIYRQVIIDYLRNKNAFSDLRLFMATDLTVDELPIAVEVDFQKMMKGEIPPDQIPEIWKYMSRVTNEWMKDEKPMSPISDIPLFVYRYPDPADRLAVSFSGLGRLLLINILLVFGAGAIMSRTSLN